MIKTKNNVTIRPAEAKDVELLVSWWANGKVMAHAGFPNGLNTNKERLLGRIKTQLNEPIYNVLYVIEAHGFRIGEMNYRKKELGIYEIGIKICDFQEQSKGYGAVAINLLLEHLFKTLQAEKIILDTNLNNTGAQRFYERLGFSQTHTELDCWEDQLGNKQSAVFYKMTKDRYQKRA